MTSQTIGACGETPESACRNISEAVRLAETSTEHHHLIILHGENKSQDGAQNELKRCFKVGYKGKWESISLTKSYEFISANGTRACITSVIKWNQREAYAFHANASNDFRVEGVDFLGIGIIFKYDNQKGGAITVKNCVIKTEHESESAIAALHMASIIIEDSFFDTTNKWKTEEKDASKEVFAVKIYRTLDHLLLRNSIIWGNFLGGSSFDSDAIHIKSLRMINFELYGSWLPMRPVTCISRCTLTPLNCSGGCTVKIINGRMENCSECSLLKVSGNDNKEFCSKLHQDLSKVEIRNVTTSKTTRTEKRSKTRIVSNIFVDLTCTALQMSDFKVINHFEQEDLHSNENLFHFKDVQGTIDNFILKHSAISKAIYVEKSVLVINNLVNVNLTTKIDYESFLYWKKSDIMINGFHIKDCNFITLMTIDTKETNATITNFSIFGNSRASTSLVKVEDGASLTIKDAVFDGTIYGGILIWSGDASITLRNALFRNTKAGAEKVDFYSDLISASGDVVLNNVTIKGCRYKSGIALYGANVVANDVTISNNVGYDHLILGDNSGKTTKPYLANMSNVYIDNTEYLERNTVWNTVFLGYPPEKMHMQNISVRLTEKQTGCLVIDGNNTQKFKDFVSASCPVKYQPVSVPRKSKRYGYEFDCTICEPKRVKNGTEKGNNGTKGDKDKGKNGSSEGMKSSMYTMVFTLIMMMLFQKATC